MNFGIKKNNKWEKWKRKQGIGPKLFAETVTVEMNSISFPKCSFQLPS